MEKRLLRLILILFITVSSCSNPVVYYSVWQGNNLFTGGDYQDATTSYLSVYDKGRFTDYISYNLANVYYALGEADAAYNEWEKALEAEDSELLFRTMYNKGVLEFESGKYEQAFDLFKKALKIMPGSREAKINLEHSLKRIDSGTNTAESSVSGADIAGNDELPDDVQRILEFVKKKEADNWKPGDDNTNIPTENDW